MKHRAVWVGILLLAAATMPLLAQSASGDALAQLLVEVRQLRLAMERAATSAPQIQLVGARLSVQNDRLARAASEHEAARRELEDVSAAGAEVMIRLQNIESRGGLAAAEQRQMDEMEGTLKQELSALAGREQRLRAREAELAAALSVEQTRWTELNRRLDEMERALGGR